MDPSRATVAQAWIWHDGGAYFGVPFENFMGWLLCVWTIFQLYVLTLRRSAQAQGSTGTPTDTRERWYQMIGLYAALSLELIGTVTDEAGVVWRLQDLYQSLGLVAIFSMVFVVLLCVAKVHATTRIGADGSAERPYHSDIESAAGQRYIDRRGAGSRGLNALEG